MSLTKRWLEDISERIGKGGLIDDEVMKKAQEEFENKIDQGGMMTYTVGDLRNDLEGFNEDMQDRIPKTETVQRPSR